MNSIQAKKILIADYLLSFGIKPVKINGNDLTYYSPFRNERTASFHVDTSKNAWFDHGTGEGGNILDLVMKMHNIADFSQALAHLDSKAIRKEYDSFSFRQQKETSKIEVLKIEPISNPILINYIKNRGIDIETAKLYCCDVYYKVGDNNYFSVGYKNDSGGYELSNPTKVKIAISPKDITTYQNDKNTCLVFEGFFDFLSFLKLKNIKEITQHNAVILNSTANLKKAIDFIKSHNEVYTFLDNDEAGKKATQELKSVCKSLSDKSSHYAKFKDMNEYLQSKITPQIPAKKQSKGRRL